MNPLQSKQSNENNLHIEYLEESFPDYEVFLAWKDSFTGNQFFSWLEEHFKEFEEDGTQEDPNLFFFTNPSTFAFRVSSEVLDINPYHLWNYWKDKLVENGYVLKNSESIYRDKLNTLRYYLKPRLKFKVEGIQLFGNITMELIKNQGKPVYLLVKCTWYQDYNFKNPEHYSELLKLMLN